MRQYFIKKYPSQDLMSFLLIKGQDFLEINLKNYSLEYLIILEYSDKNPFLLLFIIQKVSNLKLFQISNFQFFPIREYILNV